MDVERWRRIEELCQAALEQPPEKRAAFLAQACPDDPQLCAEVQSLLDQEADSFLGSAPVAAIISLSPGLKLGKFEIVERLGRGGMGGVYRAGNYRLKREVAIKTLRHDRVANAGSTQRFFQEAKSASALNHPNIVTIYDVF